MSFDFSTLITDRKQSDVDTLYSLLGKPMDQWTTEEKDKFTRSVMKGNYGYTDLNRVQEAVADLSQVLEGYGYMVGTTPQSGYSESGKQSELPMEMYLENVRKVRDTLGITLPVPDAMDGLGYEGANNIENALLLTHQRIGVMEETFVACGPATCGGDYL